MRWDIFCKVIDNHGDVGVCWRLASQLADVGDTVSLWINDPSALAWMAPGGKKGVQVVPWNATGIEQHAADPAPEVLIEAFGCDPAPERIARWAASNTSSPGRRDWINLEYLSAEPTVERLHGLPSPVFTGPGAGRTKHFFYPGFTPATGGLLREIGLAARRERFDRGQWLLQKGITWRGERLISLFCYEPAALDDLLAQLELGPQPTRLLVTAGRSSNAVSAGPAQRGALSITWLPYLTHVEFDHLLWACDLNFVRGEDSLVRALWAGAPFVWQIYPQDDGAHGAKLDAFLSWLAAPISMQGFYRTWNGLRQDNLPLLDASTLGEWQAVVGAARARLLAQDDLGTRLRQFVRQKS